MLRKLIKSKEVIEKYRMNETEFTRERKLPFWRVVVLVLSNWKKSVQNRVNKFFKEIDKLEEIPTGSAYCQSRDKLNPEIYRLMTEETVKYFYENYEEAGMVSRWKGYLLWAKDCSGINLPNNEEMREKYSIWRNQHNKEGECQGSISSLYDVLNEISIDTVLSKKKSEKSFIFEEHRKYYREEAIVLYDRAYVDYAVIAYHIKEGINFIIRGKKNKSFKQVVKFFRSKKTDEIIKIKATARQREIIKEEGLPEEVTIRVVKVFLANGEVELLLTSLIDRKTYNKEDFKEVYNKRWGVETYFDRIKNQLEIESFSSTKEIGVKQDFYGIIFLSTLESVLGREENIELQKICQEQERKYEYKLNKSVTYSAILENVVEMFLDEGKPVEKVLDDLKIIFRTGQSPIRPGREYKRTRRTPAQKFRFHKYIKRSIT